MPFGKLSPNAEGNEIDNSNYINYALSSTNFKGIRFLRESCIKLDASIITLCTASTYYNKFFTVANPQNYDPYLIANTCIFLASKVQDDDIKIRDIINVGYHTIHNNETSLSLEPYLELRDALVDCELLLMRMLNFDFEVDLPHKYLLFFMMAVKDWVGADTFNKYPLLRVSWTILLDTYHMPFVLHYPAPVIATAVMFLTFQIYGISVPGADVNNEPWFSKLHPLCLHTDVMCVASDIMKFYLNEESLSMKNT